MGYCISMDSSKFYVSVETVGRVIKILKELCYSFEQDEEGNIIEVQFSGD